MDVQAIPTALLALGSFALFLVLLRRLPPADDDVAVVVATVLRTPAELERPPRANVEEPVRWRLDLLKPRAADRSGQTDESQRASPGQVLGGQNSGWSRS